MQRILCTLTLALSVLVTSTTAEPWIPIIQPDTARHTKIIRYERLGFGIEVPLTWLERANDPSVVFVWLNNSLIISKQDKTVDRGLADSAVSQIKDQMVTSAVELKLNGTLDGMESRTIQFRGTMMNGDQRRGRVTAVVVGDAVYLFLLTSPAKAFEHAVKQTDSVMKTFQPLKVKAMPVQQTASKPPEKPTPVTDPDEEDTPKPVTIAGARGIELGDLGIVIPDNDGTLIGHVFDATTLQPIKGAVIEAERDGAFPKEGKSGKTSDKEGKYEVKTKIGRRTKKLDASRIPGTSIVGLITGGATEKTWRMDASRVNLRVRAPGYNNFEGLVSFRNAEVEGLKVFMEPIFMTPESSKEQSWIPVGWGPISITGVASSPNTISLGDKTNVSVTVAGPDYALAKLKICIDSRAIGYNKELSRNKDASTQNTAVFMKQFQVKKALPGEDIIAARVKESKYEISKNGSIGLGSLRIGEIAQVSNSSGQKTKSISSVQDAIQALRAGSYTDSTLQIAYQPPKDITPLKSGTQSDDLYVRVQAEDSKPALRTVSLLSAIEQTEKDLFQSPDVSPDRTFRLRQRLALLHYRQAAYLLGRGDPAGISATELACRNLAIVLLASRSSAYTTSEGQQDLRYGTTISPEIRASVGFNVPEGDSDFLLLHSLMALAKNPTSYLHWSNTAHALYELREYVLAIQAADRCLKLNPEYSEAMVQKGSSLVMLSKDRQAQPIIESAVKLNPRHITANMFLAGIYDRSGSPVAAETAMDTHFDFYGIAIR